MLSGGLMPNDAAGGITMCSFSASGANLLMGMVTADDGICGAYTLANTNPAFMADQCLLADDPESPFQSFKIVSMELDADGTECPEGSAGALLYVFFNKNITLLSLK